MTNQPESDPLLTVRHRQLSAILRRLREDRGLSQAECADALHLSRQRYGRLETGVSKFKAGELESILDLLGCEQALRLALLELGKNLNVRGWWTSYDDVLSDSYARIETDAREVRTYQTNLVPGQLQTPEYTMALARLGQPDDEEKQHRQVAARAARRRRIASADGPLFHAIIAETVLHKPIGGPVVHQAQLRAIVLAATRPNVQIQVLPTATWEHPGHEGSFVIFGFGGPSALDVAYFEGAAGSSIYLEKSNEVDLCTVNFDRISKAALPQTQSVALVEGLLV